MPRPFTVIPRTSLGGARAKTFATSGFTLVELLVVVAIIGVLVALLLPAVQSSREAARKTTCRNHLKQLGLGSHSHLESQGHFPTGGWGCSWTGDPDRGFGVRQPGGWVFNLLPFMEEQSLHDTGSGNLGQAKLESAASVIQSPLDLLHCPTRRAVRLYPNGWPYTLFNASDVPMLARCDYAINAGDVGSNSVGASSSQCGPPSHQSGDDDSIWPSTSHLRGICFPRSVVRAAQISDGLSHTYLIGEKYLNTTDYDTGMVESDRGHAYSGFAPDTVRLAATTLLPRQDSSQPGSRSFGSAHATGCHFTFCDGSVRLVTYGIEPELHRRSGNREDGEVAY